MQNVTQTQLYIVKHLDLQNVLEEKNYLHHQKCHMVHSSLHLTAE